MSYDFVSCLPPVSLCWCACVHACTCTTTASLHGLCHSVFFFSCATVHVCFPVLRRQYPCCIIITVYTITALSYEEVTTQVIINNAGPYNYYCSVYDYTATISSVSSGYIQRVLQRQTNLVDIEKSGKLIIRH